MAVVRDVLAIAGGDRMEKAATYPERSAVRHGDGEVGHHSDQAIGNWRPEGQVVRDLMDGKEEVLVRGSADDVCKRPEFP